MTLFQTRDKANIGVMKSLTRDFFRQYGVECVYLPKDVTGQDDVLNENVQTSYPVAFVLPVVFTDTPVDLGSPMIDKFGLSYLPGNSYVAEIDKEMFNEQWAKEGQDVVTPEIGDLVYVKGAKTFMEVMDVTRDPKVLMMDRSLATYKITMSLWENNMDEFPNELMVAFDDMEGFNDLVAWRRDNDIMGYRLPDQDGDTSCVDDLNQPLIANPDQLPVDPATLDSTPEDFADAMDDAEEEKIPFAHNKQLKDAKDFGWS